MEGLTMTKEEEEAKRVREEPGRVAAEKRQKAHEWFNENILEVVALLKGGVASVKEAKAEKAKRASKKP